MTKFNNKNALIFSLLGAISTIPGEIVTLILVMLGIGNHDVYRLNSIIITLQVPSFIIGGIVNFTVGGFVGILLYVITKVSGSDYIVAVSVFLSMLMWFIFEVLFTAIYEGLLNISRSSMDHYVHLVGTTTFGFTLGLLSRMVQKARKLD